eukprot:3158175-Rhodomonas_salina.1
MATMLAFSDATLALMDGILLFKDALLPFMETVLASMDAMLPFMDTVLALSGGGARLAPPHAPLYLWTRCCHNRRRC